MTENTDYPFDEIESLIDRHGLAKVLRAIEEVCQRKAEHIAVNWQDTGLAKRWSGIAGIVGRGAAHAEMVLP